MRTHALCSQIVARVFTELRVSAALISSGVWYPIHVAPTVIRFEVAHGSELRRWAYNDHAIAEARRTGRIVLGEHAGFHDLFVPVEARPGSRDVLVTGPFSLGRPTSSDVLVRWQDITGQVGRAADPEFRHYLSTTLATLTFDAAGLSHFKRLLAGFATLLEAKRDAQALTRNINGLRAALAPTRLFERMAEVSRDFIDDRLGLLPTDPPNTDLQALGMRRVLRHAVVGLLLGPSSEGDPLDGLLLRDEFQRACADLCVARGGMIGAPIGDHGIAVLTDDAGSASRARAALSELAHRLRALARRFGFKLHAGIAPSDVGIGLPGRYQAALAAAENAISRGVLVVEAGRGAAQSSSPLRDLRANLGVAIRENPKLLAPSFSRYLDAITAHCGYRIEPIRAHLEGAFDMICQSLRTTGVMDERGIAELESTIRSAAGKANSLGELLASYREAAADIEIALAQPASARKDRSMRRAVAYIRDHLSDPISLGDVSRIAGFAPAHFSTTFRQSEGEPFRVYLRRLRVERAKYMLTATTLSVERVGQLCGFPSRNRFHLAFRSATRTSPAAYRRGASSKRPATVLS